MATGICPFCGKKVDKFIMFRGDVVGCRYCGIHAKQTNADRIRAMTDEELADLYMKAIEDEEYPGWWGNRMGLLAWLKQEAVSDG